VETGSAGIVAKATVFIQVTLAVEEIVKKRVTSSQVFCVSFAGWPGGAGKGTQF